MVAVGYERNLPVLTCRSWMVSPSAWVVGVCVCPWRMQIISWDLGSVSASVLLFARIVVVTVVVAAHILVHAPTVPEYMHACVHDFTHTHTHTYTLSQIAHLISVARTQTGTERGAGTYT